MALETSTKAARVAGNAEFLKRVDYLMKKAAIAVMAEAAVTKSHAERVVYAKKILAGTASVSEYARAVVTNATIAAATDAGAENQGVTDSDLEFTLNSMLNAHAGVAL